VSAPRKQPLDAVTSSDSLPPVEIGPAVWMEADDRFR
jgi:hypothetical protein